MHSLRLLAAIVVFIQTGLEVQCYPSRSEHDSSACRRPHTCIASSDCVKIHRDFHGEIIFICGTDPVKGRKICCPPAKPAGHKQKPGTSSHRPTPKPSAVTVRLANMKLLPTLDCGYLGGDKISNGDDAASGQFPWMALLGYKLENNPVTQYLCAGTLINNRYVMTAAHCLNSTAGDLVSVRLGELDMDTEPDCYADSEGVQVCADPHKEMLVEKVIIHPMYNTPNLKHDIALIRFRQPVAPFPTDTIRPICLPFGLNVTGAEEKKVIIAGWGKTDWKNDAGNSRLKFANIKTTSIDDCNLIQTTRVHTVDDNQLCAGGATGEDACRGDSGGPLMDAKSLPERDGPQMFQFGIVSFGLYPCGSQNAPSVYTRVTAYLDWILENIEK